MKEGRLRTEESSVFSFYSPEKGQVSKLSQGYVKDVWTAWDLIISTVFSCVTLVTESSGSPPACLHPT